MAEKAINTSDLQNLKNEIKLEISKEQTELRHEDRKKLSDCVWKVDELDKKSAVNDNVLKNMSTNFQEMKDSFDKLVTKIEWFPDRFATKEDHKENSVKISGIEKALDNINLKIAWVSGGFAVIIFLIDKYGTK